MLELNGSKSMKTYSLHCGKAVHEIAVDEYGKVFTFDHDFEEEEVLGAMGMDTSRCFAMAYDLREDPDKSLVIGAGARDLEFVKLALMAGADPDAGQYAGDPLWYAHRHRKLEMAKILLDAGADIKLQTDEAKAWVSANAELLGRG